MPIDVDRCTSAIMARIVADPDGRLAGVDYSKDPTVRGLVHYIVEGVVEELRDHGDDLPPRGGPMAVDVLLDDSLDLPHFPVHGSGTDVTLQRIGIRLRTWHGEWFLDSRVGLLRLDWLQTKPPPVELISAAVQAELEDTPGVARVYDVEATFDLQARTISVSGSLLLESEEESLTFEAALDSVKNTTPSLVFYTRSGAIVRGFGA